MTLRNNTVVCKTRFLHCFSHFVLDTQTNMQKWEKQLKKLDSVLSEGLSAPDHHAFDMASRRKVIDCPRTIISPL